MHATLLKTEDEAKEVREPSFCVRVLAVVLDVASKFPFTSLNAAPFSCLSSTACGRGR